MNDIKKKIASRIRDFGLDALLNLLLSLGYKEDQIYFRSHLSSKSPPSLLEGITFNDSQEVEIRINWGLFSEVGPLPAFFFKKISQEHINLNDLRDYLSFFDDYIVKSYFSQIYPENNQDIYPSWRSAKYNYWKIFPTNSLYAVYWLFQTAFSELQLDIKIAKCQKVYHEKLIYEKNILPINSYYASQCLKYEVYLYSHENITASKIPWEKEVISRLKHILTFFKETNLFIEIKLILDPHNFYRRCFSLEFLSLNGFLNDLENLNFSSKGIPIK